ncbi:MAG: DUF3450 domain-containing protein [Gammaproteobacteria bacterium]|nr:DUF3450 domain-containing protein [Gammaproteobacteria bacterium]
MKRKIILLLIFFVGGSAHGDDIESLKNISKELVDIRHQIENLHNQINNEKELYTDQFRSYSNQKSDLDVKISRADLNIKDLERELNRLIEINKEHNRDYDEIVPVIKESIALLRARVSTSLPFMRSQRLDALADIEHRLDTNIISPNKAANQLWAFVEDELVLGRSSGIYNDTLEIDGKKELVKVLRVGKIALFYQTANDQYGVIKRQGEDWVQKKLKAEESIAKLDNLFDSFNKNIRNGFFELPNFLPRN